MSPISSQFGSNHTITAAEEQLVLNFLVFVCDDHKIGLSSGILGLVPEAPT
jgi:hypothetical protein